MFILRWFGQITSFSAIYERDNSYVMDLELDQVLHKSLRPVAIVMSIMYLVLALGHFFLLAGLTRQIMTSIALGTGITFLVIYFRYKYFAWLPERAHLLASLGCLLAGLNSLAHLWLVPEPKQSTNIALLLIAAGSFLLITRWYVVVCAIAFIGWALLALKAPPSPDWIHFTFLILESLALSVTIFTVRRRLQKRMVYLLQAEHAKNIELRAAVEERERAEQQAHVARDTAEAASRAKTTFLASMSHELRTPLAAILGYSELIQREIEDQGQAELLEDVTRIRSAGTHLLSLITDILDLSKVEAGKMDLHIEKTDATMFITNVINNVQSLAAQHDNTLKVHISDDVQVVYIDSIRTRQVLINLLGNACQYTENGVISLDVCYGDSQIPAQLRDQGKSVLEDGSYLFFRVSDTGIGMSETQLSHLFEDFVQAHLPKKHHNIGSGLGLALSRRLSRLMGGDIIVSSEIGKGSVFTFYLPQHAPESSEEDYQEKSIMLLQTKAHASENPN